jgi:hypothetical protein
MLFTLPLVAQQTGPVERKQLFIKKTNQPVKIDGVSDEMQWQDAGKADGFWKKFPTDDGPATRNTEARVMYDDQYLYVSFTAYDSTKPYIQSLRRDNGHDGSDGVAIILDPQNQKTNGFFFVVNAYNAQSEDLVSPGTEISWSWDNKWLSATKRYNHYWTAEVAIPFKTLRYAAGKQEWAINFLRIDTKSNEYDVWNKVPVNFMSYDLGYTGVLNWDAPPPSPGRNIVFIPYTTASAASNKLENEATKLKANAGFDAKIAINSALNLDLTVNPDFAQVEVDRQVTNLTRFNIFFPERRNFFLENADLYSSFGIPPVRPFYSRRIGLDRNARAIPILGGARLTGNLNKTTRIGLLNMQTGKTDDYSAENYTAVTISKRVLKRSSINGYFLNRSAFLTEAEKQSDPMLQFGRNAGIELFYSDEEGKWLGWSNYHHSWKPGLKNNRMFYNFGGTYSGRKFRATLDVGELGTNYYTDMGFIERVENYDAVRDTVIRLGFKQAYFNSQYIIFPKKGRIAQHQFELENYLVINPSNSFNENNSEINYSIIFKNTSSLGFGYEFNMLQLLFPISFTDGIPLPIRFYRYGSAGISYNSDFREPFAVNFDAGTGGFYNGRGTQLEAGITYRSIPHVNVAINFNYYNLRFPDLYGKTTLFLISPRVEVNFTNNIFWTTFLQYNTQGNNFNINSRFQWRFKPMSDLFLVYTDNYFTDPLLKNKNRALILKFQYWLNL